MPHSDNVFLGENYSRRKFIQRLSFGLSGSLLLPFASFGENGFADGYATGNPSEQTLERIQSGKKLGIALVGLGKYSTEQLAPALQKTKLCHLAGIVTGTPAKATEWKKKYNIPDANVYNYQNFEDIANNPAIDIIYVVLPNPMHEEYVIRAAKAGKHVICEKPMAMTEQECQNMIDACEKANRKLSIGYRLHFEPHHQYIMQTAQNQGLGKVNKIIAYDGQIQGEDSPWRLGKGVGGGGPMRDLGVYCIQGSIYSKGELPVSVTAQYHPKKDPVKFKLIEEGIDFQLQFADGSVSECHASFNEKYNKLRVEGTQGWIELEPSFAYEGLKGKTNKGPMNIANVSQQTLQMDDFADCVINDKPTRVPGAMGKRDVSIVNSVFEAAKTGNKVKVTAQPVMDMVGNKR